MINEKMRKLGAKRSSIRELFEYGKARAGKIGEDNVFDFSIGNPSVPPPDKVSHELIRLLTEESSMALHGYTSAQGDPRTRAAVADYISKRYGALADPDLIYMTCGAAAALTIALNALVSCGEEVIVNAPYFPEYKVFIEKAGGVVREVLTTVGDFQPDIEALEAAITEKCAAVIINSPNNPSGAVITEENLKRLSALLKKKEKELDKTIYLISDEPYRELVYDGVEVPFVSNYYDDTVICYSFSKSLSLPGERIGYIMLSPSIKSSVAVYQAICGAGRALGYVCAPSLLQKMIPEVIGTTSNISVYEKNRSLLYDALTKYGYSVVRPDGAFYLFVKSPEENAAAFCERAKEFELLLVPSDDFGILGYVRISYCVFPERIEKSLPAFKALAKAYGLI